LLNAQGNIAEAGWSRRMLLTYDRNAIRVGKLKIKEWDYYLVNDGEYGIALTIADNGYMGMISASLLDFKRQWEHTQTVIKPFSMGKYNMPASSECGDVVFAQSGLDMRFIKEENARRLQCTFDNFHEKKALTLDIHLDEPMMDTMVIATPFDKPRHFYYNQKINCMRASGSVNWGDMHISFAPENAFGTLDWGRGVWTYDNTWYWGSGNGEIDGKPFGFNIGYGFGNTAAATENTLFYDGVAHKLEDVRFHIPADSFMNPWTFSSSDGRFEMDFTPVIDRAARINALVLETDQHQVFGRFSGRAVLDDGSVLTVSNLMGFAEKVRNKY
ncbi:DUF2804 domain-containing protein, partial [Christensenellaceae bacterium OttesenSCG-928-L17]|nr:DUF2804 domain-containing protein [Christensenellaceae bacterium OttesenSCG-928-L17]